MNEYNLKNAKILIVDDLEDNIHVLHDFLEIQGYDNIMSTTDPRNVINLVFEFNPDIILLDLAMPYLSGFDVMDQLKEIIQPTVYLPILVLTADITVQTKRKALLSGACDFLAKPFDLIELQARVNTHLLIRYKNEQINNYTAQLEGLIATKDKFFSIIAHDLRNPFVGIQNYIKIIQQFKNYNPAVVNGQFQTISSTAQHGYELLENLLRWARSQTDTIKTNFDKLNLKNEVDNCINIVRTQAEIKKIILLADVPDNIVVDTDSDMLRTIFRNLLTNAIKYTSDGGKVTLSAQIATNFVEIAISDSGIGIEPDDIDGLFRIDKNLKSREGTNSEKGSGLGLILCKEFVDRLGGTIQVESEVGKGTTFTLRLK
jgi:two-component system, sensor histidine kinase and response regulator